MNSRAQLNISINKELIKSIKQKALKSNINTGTFVNNLLKCYLTSLDLSISSTKTKSKLKEIENKLLQAQILIENIIIDNKIDNYFYISDEGAKLYSTLLAKQFKEYANNELITNKEAWKHFVGHTDEFLIKSFHIDLFKDVLRGERHFSIDEVIYLVKYYGQCPIIEVLRTMTKGNLIKELESLSNKYILFAMNK